jgi:plasmid stabilization system protein ParE
MKLIFRNRALVDIEAIQRYIAKHNHIAAQRVVTRERAAA